MIDPSPGVRNSGANYKSADSREWSAHIRRRHRIGLGQRLDAFRCLPRAAAESPLISSGSIRNLDGRRVGDISYLDCRRLNRRRRVRSSCCWSARPADRRSASPLIRLLAARRAIGLISGQTTSAHRHRPVRESPHCRRSGYRRTVPLPPRFLRPIACQTAVFRNFG